MSTTSVVAISSSQLPKLHLMPLKIKHHRSDEACLRHTIHEAYSRLTHEQLVFFLTLRKLPTDGSDDELASRLTGFDIKVYGVPQNETQYAISSQNGHINVPVNPPILSVSPVNGTRSPRQPQSRLPDLPTELLAEILDRLGDWELSKAVGLPTSLSRPLSWARASATDEAMLSGFVPLIRSVDPARCPPTRTGVTLTIRFGYVHVLDTLLHVYRAPCQFLHWFRDDIIPIVASEYGRTSVLTWWKHAVDSGALPGPQDKSISESIDRACRNGARASLEWWLASRFPLTYGDSALEAASAKNHVDVLEWWRENSTTLPLKIGRSVDMASSAGHTAVLAWWIHSGFEFKYDKTALHHASMHGKVEVLQWWLDSGLQLIFDQEALVLATRHNRPEVLEWWDRSGLPIQYRICDIEEALEDAIGGGEAARVWWRKKGVNFNANDKEWMKLQTLN